MTWFFVCVVSLDQFKWLINVSLVVLFCLSEMARYFRVVSLASEEEGGHCDDSWEGLYDPSRLRSTEARGSKSHLQGSELWPGDMWKKVFLQDRGTNNSLI